MLKDKVILVTGASRGIGRAIATELAQQDALVIGTATSIKGAEAISDFFSQHKLNGHGVVLNVTEQDSIEALRETLKTNYKMPDILINNAGITRDNLFMRMKEDEWDDVINANLKGIYRMCKLCIRPMIKNRWGRIINISSISGCAGSPGQTNYAAAKAGLIGFSKSLAKEVASRNITINVIAPGFVKSDMTDALPEDYQEKLLSNIPMGRVGLPEEIAAAAAFLASTNASYITGETLHVNGGMYMA
ncbi:MAG: 3-oxoacyl-ACP reductase FabG [Gammaproteobacteria bacterium]|nr:3-oxoacyl-ACP reductase FabG [Gammaproteobacteria bacterium]